MRSRGHTPSACSGRAWGANALICLERVITSVKAACQEVGASRFLVNEKSPARVTAIYKAKAEILLSPSQQYGTPKRCLFHMGT